MCCTARKETRREVINLIHYPQRRPGGHQKNFLDGKAVFIYDDYGEAFYVIWREQVKKDVIKLWWDKCDATTDNGIKQWKKRQRKRKLPAPRKTKSAKVSTKSVNEKKHTQPR